MSGIIIPIFFTTLFLNRLAKKFGVYFNLMAIALILSLVLLLISLLLFNALETVELEKPEATEISFIVDFFIFEQRMLNIA